MHRQCSVSLGAKHSPLSPILPLFLPPLPYPLFPYKYQVKTFFLQITIVKSRRNTATLNFLRLTFQIESSTSSVDSCTDANTNRLLGTWWTSVHQFPTSFSASVCDDSAFGQQSPTVHTKLPAQHVRLSGVFCCWPDCLELLARRPSGSGVLCWQLQTVAEDTSIFAVLMCSAH